MGNVNWEDAIKELEVRRKRRSSEAGQRKLRNSTPSVN